MLSNANLCMLIPPRHLSISPQFQILRNNPAFQIPSVPAFSSECRKAWNVLSATQLDVIITSIYNITNKPLLLLKTVTIAQPSYRTNLHYYHNTTHATRSSNKHLLQVPLLHSTSCCLSFEWPPPPRAYSLSLHLFLHSVPPLKLMGK